VAWVVLVAVLALLTLQVREASRRFRAGRMLRQVEILTLREAASGRVSPSVTAANFRLLRKAEELDPLLIGVPIARGSQYLFLRRPDEAIAAYEKALELEIRPEIHLNIGRAHLMAGREEAALGAFALAVRLAPGLRREVPEELRKEVVRRAGLSG